MGVKLVCTDIDGVVFDIDSSWAEFHKHFNTYLEKFEKLKQSYLKGEISYLEWANEEVKAWMGLPYSKFCLICEGFPLVSGIEEVVRELKRKGYYMVAISSGGLYTPVNRRLKKLGYDEVYSNDLEEVDGRVTGRPIINVEYGNKDFVLEKVLNERKISWEECAAIGNDMNDENLLSRAGLSIAFRPKDERLAKKAKIVIRKDIREVLKYL